MYISRRALGAEGSANNYLLVGSRPFAAVTLPGSVAATPCLYVPPRLECDLRQTTWQKICCPSAVRNVVAASFRPYTMVESCGPPVNGSGGSLWPRICEGRTWMPFSWVTAGRQVGQQTVPAGGIVFCGPCLVIDASARELPNPDDNARLVSSVPYACLSSSRAGMNASHL